MQTEVKTFSCPLLVNSVCVAGNKEEVQRKTELNVTLEESYFFNQLDSV